MISSAMVEPTRGVIDSLILDSFLNDFVVGVLFAGVAGVMVFLAIDTLLPTAKNSARGHLTVYGFMLGMSVVALSLVLLQL